MGSSDTKTQGGASFQTLKATHTYFFTEEKSLQSCNSQRSPRIIIFKSKKRLRTFLSLLYPSTPFQINFSIFFGKLNASFFSMILIYPYFSRSRNHPHEPTIGISADCFSRGQTVFPDLQGCDSLSSTSSLESGEIL